MKKYKDLYKTNGFWMTKIQNDLYLEVKDYLKKSNLNQTEFAQILGVSKGYISQVMNGNFNYTLSKFIDLSLAINKVPFTWENLDEYSEKLEQQTFTRVVSLKPNNFVSITPSNNDLAKSAIYV